MKRIFIVSRQPLFARGIESLLRSASGLEVVGRAGDVAEALSRIGELRPDVTILGDDECEPQAAQFVLRILGQGVCGWVVAVDLQSNSLCVFAGRRREVTSAADLVDAIRGGAPGNEISDRLNSVR
ncbi:MAG TPA: hypothetical protein PLJ35_00365 [Anaerolineae bacterium]|nr:hypothetical protein [Anaerolineae bacterium]HOQ97254.1 hypothetical protein [Anaerolineae bacterium]HPL27656.1 hypothetical protein [Anaerolineae bacterium]